MTIGVSCPNVVQTSIRIKTSEKHFIFVNNLGRVSKIPQISRVVRNKSAITFVQMNRRSIIKELIIIIGLIVWFFLKLDYTKEQDNIEGRLSLDKIKKVIKLPSVYLLMIIILCAYMGYKTTDIISLYAKDIMMYNHVNSAQIANLLLYCRPIIAILIAIYLSNLDSKILLVVGFLITGISSSFFFLGISSQSSNLIFIISIIFLAIGVYALRALYFSVLEEGRIPVILTGTAVGVISIIGYTPDIFSGPLIGYFIDSYEGVKGYNFVFMILSGFSFIGAFVASRFYKIYSKA